MGDPIQVKGTAITSRVRFVRDRFGEDAYRRVKASLSPEHRAAIDARILPHQWAPFSLFVELNIRVDGLLGGGDLSLCREMGRFGAEVNLPTIYRIFYKLGTPAFILRKAARLWELHYSSGRMEADTSRSDMAILTVHDFGAPHRAHCLSVLGWATRSAELSGAAVRSSEETHCRTRGDDRCEFVIDWRR